jgi:hypothetical protein
MQKFGLRKDAFKELRKKMLTRTIPLMVIAATAGIAISSLNRKNTPDDVNVLPIVIPMAAIVVGFSLFRSTKAQQAILESYTLTISDVAIKRDQLNTETISISLNDIEAIIKQKSGAFLVMGKAKQDLINIPAQIESYEAVEAALQKLCAITVRENTAAPQKYQLLLGLVPIALMIGVYTVNNKIVVAISGTLFIGMVAWGLVATQQNKNIDNKTKKGMWWALVVVASVVAVMYFKISGKAAIN